MGKQMSFLDHLEELRKHLIRIFIVVILFAIVAFVFSKYIFEHIILAVTRSNFITYRIMCDLTSGVYCIDEITYSIQSTEPASQFSVDIWVAITFGVIFAFPFILREIWKFIVPALYENERKLAITFLLSTSFLFFLGILFGYYIIAPISIKFFGTYKVNPLVENIFTISSFINLIKTSVLASGVMFELPVIIFFLAKLGLVDSEGLKKYRKVMLIVILALSAIITPPDILSQIIVAIPVMALYELSIYIAKFMEKKEKSLVKK